jgi:hypothetical protein
MDVSLKIMPLERRILAALALASFGNETQLKLVYFVLHLTK